jgi:hypothetical protein
MEGVEAINIARSFEKNANCEPPSEEVLTEISRRRQDGRADIALSRQAMPMEAIQQVADRNRQVIVSLMGQVCAESIRRPEHTKGIDWLESSPFQYRYHTA